MKVLAVCGSGMGTSMIMKMKMKKVLDKLKIAADVSSCSIGEAKSGLSNYDIVISSIYMVGELNVKAPTILIGVQNMLNEAELEEKLKLAGIGV
ncbi:PTS sugar transporter subunit IIB [Streptobacillus moniliformis]|uniref:PTS sugar transporter subunit IIB n=1 Tax=Streptobacillus moniliformis TaxID=34105 RepID=UPI0007E34E56|nr:PTS ascorbate transporter subunit IIB [Streptobacillus moniliformis]